MTEQKKQPKKIQKQSPQKEPVQPTVTKDEFLNVLKKAARKINASAPKTKE